MTIGTDESFTYKKVWETPLPPYLLTHPNIIKSSSGLDWTGLSGLLWELRLFGFIFVRGWEQVEENGNGV
jgi:hypothetical protein